MELPLVTELILLRSWQSRSLLLLLVEGNMQAAQNSSTKLLYRK